MPDQVMLAIGGLSCGLAAGAAAQYGRLCTFAAIEDALVGGDLRRARAWALALGVAMLATQGLVLAGLLDPLNSFHSAGRIELLALSLGALAFGIGMALIGTCGFGLLVRGGAGDLRALMMAVVLGIAAFAATGGPLSGLRIWIGQFGVIQLGPGGSGSMAVLAGHLGGLPARIGLTVVLPLGLTLFALWSARVRRKPRLLAAAVLLGSAIAGGWMVTGPLADPFVGQRLESLTFVAPIGRVLLVTMGESIANAGFAVMSVLGVVLGSLAVALARRELRWEAFDDQREMRRHILGAVLMGVGGVLARGCTIGQGLSAFSMLAVTAPIVITGMVIGARLGLAYLIDRPSIGKSRMPWSRQDASG